MRKLLLFAFFMSFGLTTSLFAQDEAAMKQWQEFMTPGKMHQMLATTVGNWNAEMRMWMAPNTEPTLTTGTSKTESLLGGRYFRTVHNASFMGMPMEGIDVSGFDNARKVFHSYWIDNFGTGTMYLEGTLDEATKTINFLGASYDFTGKKVKVRETLKHIDADNMYMEMFMDEGSGEWKSMEIKFTRAK